MRRIPGNRSYENILIKLRSRARNRNDDVKHRRELEAPGRNNEANLRIPDLPVYRGHEPGEAETWVIVTLEAAARCGHGEANCLPRNTLMELAAITFPRVLSAVGSRAAAFLVAKASIMLVPKVRMVMAVTSSLRPTRHPNILAKSLNNSLS